MASIENRRTKNKITRYRVKWRTGGTREGAQDGATFDAHSDAKRFKALVEAHGHQWPPAEVLLAQGFAHLALGTIVMLAAPVENDIPVTATFESFAIEYVERLRRVL